MRHHRVCRWFGAGRKSWWAQRVRRTCCGTLQMRDSGVPLPTECWEWIRRRYSVEFPPMSRPRGIRERCAEATQREVFTSGLSGVYQQCRIALYFHRVHARRESGRGADTALFRAAARDSDVARNAPGLAETMVANCSTGQPRNFPKVTANFPEVGSCWENLGEVTATMRPKRVFISNRELGGPVDPAQT